MTDIIEIESWTSPEDTDDLRQGRRRRYLKLVEQLKERPNDWALLKTEDIKQANNLRSVLSNERYPGVEAVVRDGKVYARYVPAEEAQ